MNLIVMLIAGAGMSLGLGGPDGEACSADCTAECCTAEGKEHKETGEAAHCDTEGKTECALACSTEKLPEIDSALYGNAAWPAHNDPKSLYSKNLQGKPMPVALGSETVLSAEMTHEATKGKVLIVDFWATWCGPCIAAAPKLADLQNTHAGNLQVVGISGLNETQETVQSFVDKHDEPFLQLYDNKQTVFKHFESTGIPLVAVVSTDGVIRWLGNPHQPDFKAAVEQVLKVDPMVQAKVAAKDS